MSRFFKPYEGKRPYLFISYPHARSQAVVETIRILHEKGFRLWYDEGIPAGSDWPENIARHMRECEAVVFFLSAEALRSPNCFSEIRTAHRLGKPMLVVRLDESDCAPEWSELLDRAGEIPVLNSPAERAEALLRSGFVGRRYRRRWREKVRWQALGLAASLLLFLAAGSAFALLASGRWVPLPPPETVTETPKPTAAPTAQPVLELGGAERFFAVRFPDSQQETAVRRALGMSEGEIQRWNLAEIRTLSLCGNMVLRGGEEIRFDPDGTCRVNGAPVILGKVSDLSLAADMARLEKLDLICQPLGSLSPLGGHLLLRELSLAGSGVDSVEELTELPALETLDLAHTRVTDLGALEALPALKTVRVSREMLPLRWSKNADFDVVLLVDPS